MKPQLSRSHRRTYDGIFRHPVARNLGWRDVRSMLGALAEVVEEPNGNLKITRNGQTLVLHPSLDKNVAEIEELMEIRHFLERSSAVSPEAVAEGTHLLVVIDHRQARIYETQRHGSVPQQITPYGADRHLQCLGDLLIGKALDIRQYHDNAVVVGQGIDRSAQVLDFQLVEKGLFLVAPPEQEGMV